MKDVLDSPTIQTSIVSFLLNVTSSQFKCPGPLHNTAIWVCWICKGGHEIWFYQCEVFSKVTTDQLINIFAGLLCRVCHNDEPQDNDQTSKFPLVGPSSLLIGQDLVDLSSLIIGQDLVDQSSRDLFKSKQLPILVDLDLGKISFL